MRRDAVGHIPLRERRHSASAPILKLQSWELVQEGETADSLRLGAVVWRVQEGEVSWGHQPQVEEAVSVRGYRCQQRLSPVSPLLMAIAPARSDRRQGGRLEQEIRRAHVMDPLNHVIHPLMRVASTGALTDPPRRLSDLSRQQMHCQVLRQVLHQVLCCTLGPVVSI